MDCEHVREEYSALLDGELSPEARAAVEAALGGMGLSVQDDGQTQYLLFLSQAGIDALVDVCDGHWDELAKIVDETGAAESEGDEAATRRSARDAKKAARQAVPDQIREALDELIEICKRVRPGKPEPTDINAGDAIQ